MAEIKYVDEAAAQAIADKAKELAPEPDTLRVNTSNELTTYDGTTHVDTVKLGQSTSDGATADANGKLIVKDTFDYNDDSGEKGLSVIEIKYVPWDESGDPYVFSSDNYGDLTIVERFYHISADGSRMPVGSAKYMTDLDLVDTSSGTPDENGYYQFFPELLPKATADALGAVKVGDGLSIDDDGALSLAARAPYVVLQIETSEISLTSYSSGSRNVGTFSALATQYENGYHYINGGSFRLADSYTEDQTFGDATLKVGVNYPIVSGRGISNANYDFLLSAIPDSVTYFFMCCATNASGSLLMGGSESGLTLPALSLSLQLVR